MYVLSLSFFPFQFTTTVKDLRFIGMTEGGIHMDDFELEDPDVLNEHYGVHGQVRPPRPGETGAGYTEEDEFDRMSNVLSEHEINEETERNMNHEPVSVPAHADPFETDEQHEAFWAALEHANGNNSLPDGFNLSPEDHQEGVYPTFEVLRMGRRRVELPIELPIDVWLPRSVLWCQALDILFRFETGLEI